MNITMGVAAISERARRLLPVIWSTSMEIGAEAYDLSDAVTRVTSRRAVVNARGVTGTWKVPTWLEDQYGVIALSQPPVSFTTRVSSEAWPAWASATLRSDAARRSVQPGYFGVNLWNDDGMEIWSDVLGFGRAYVVENDDFIAVSNHIGMVSLFSSKALTTDEYGAAVLSQIGFWPEHNSPISEVRRLPPGEVISIGVHDEVTRRTYAHAEEYYGYRDAEPDVAGAADTLATLAANAGEIAWRLPVVYLSGGQDSRVTAAAWLAGGQPATVHTTGTLEGEVTIARQLMGVLDREQPLAERGVEHKVSIPNAQRLSQFSIEDRLAQALLFWDGDFAPGNLKATVQRPSKRGRLSIGGANGEVMHSMYYPTPEVLARVRTLGHPIDRLAQAHNGRANTPESRQHFMSYLERQKEFMAGIGQFDATAFNVFLADSKYRRWINAQLHANTVILLANPTFVRACIDLTPEQRQDRFMQRSLSTALIPQWSGVPYYKASSHESTTSYNSHGIRIWETSPGSMEKLLHERDDWKQWFDEDSMYEIEDLIDAGGGAALHESTLSRAYVLDAIPGHVGSLEKIRIKCWLGTP